MRGSCSFAVVPLLVAAVVVAAGEGELVEIVGIDPGRVAMQAFELGSPQRLVIEATAIACEKGAGQFSEAWILDATSRKPVWTLSSCEPARRRGQLHRFRETVSLPAGIYEVYYSLSPMGKGLDELPDGWLGEAVRSVVRFFGGDEAVSPDDLRIAVRGSGTSLAKGDVAAVQAKIRASALVSIAAETRHFSASRGFVLERPAKLEVYAIGEVLKDGGYDYGWIIDSATRERVWEFDLAHSKWAGGSTKNRAVRQVLTLKAGEYGVFFVTDGSHSPDGWNSAPPHDPSFWGITLWLKDPADRQFARATDYRHLPEDRVVVELTGVGDGERRQTGIRVEEACEVRVYALGEGGKKRMIDFGWIADATSRREIWTMAFDRTRPAGGAAKNREIDEVIRLDPGTYVVAYVTDDSHSYPRWNAAPPNEPERWGITLFAGEGTVHRLDPEARVGQDESVLARLVAVGSDQHRQHRFVLLSDARVAVYALGEGLGGEMYDRGWIENATSGKPVWSMDFTNTQWAGGSSKNRRVRADLDLPAGSYVAHYATDDSHDFSRWNAAPPHDPSSWGIQVTLVD